MAPSVCFHFKREHFWFWEEITKCYGVEKAYVIGVPDDHYDYSLPNTQMVEIGGWSEIPGDRVLFSAQDSVVIPGTHPLKDYVHPSDITYCFGSDDQYPTVWDGPLPIVYIEANTSLWSFQAAGIVLRDRMIKAS